jgi:hypothetical protein
MSTAKNWGIGPTHHHKDKSIVVSMHFHEAFINHLRQVRVQDIYNHLPGFLYIPFVDLGQ